MPKRVPGNLKAIISATVAVLIICLAAVSLICQAATDTLWQGVRDHSEDLAVSLAQMVDGDRHAQLIAEYDETIYHDLLKPLVAAHQFLPDAYYIYTFAPSTDNDGDTFILDTAVYPELVSHGREVEASAYGDFAPDESPIEDQLMRQTVLSGKPFSYPEPYTDAFGTFVTAQAPIFDASGIVQGYLGVDLDIQVLNTGNAAIHRYALAAIIAASLLATLVAYAGWQILQRQQAAREQAENDAANQERFMAMISEEVLTPLNGIMTGVELLDSLGMTPEQRRRVNSVTACSDLLCRQFQDIVDYHRIRYGQIALNATDVVLRELVNETIDWISYRPDIDTRVSDHGSIPNYHI